jgi:hypothetical protein
MTDMPRLLAGEWGSFAKAVGISDAPPLQLRDMKRCSIAGARAYSGFLMRNASADNVAVVIHTQYRAFEPRPRPTIHSL